jgi:hypothetical protein
MRWRAVLIVLAFSVCCVGVTLLLVHTQQAVLVAPNNAPSVPVSVPAERGVGLGATPVLTPVVGQPVRNSARAIEQVRRDEQYRRDYSKYNIDKP